MKTINFNNVVKVKANVTHKLKCEMYVDMCDKAAIRYILNTFLLIFVVPLNYTL